jgi:hypothetical protein
MTMGKNSHASRNGHLTCSRIYRRSDLSDWPHEKELLRSAQFFDGRFSFESETFRLVFFKVSDLPRSSSTSGLRTFSSVVLL